MKLLYITPLTVADILEKPSNVSYYVKNFIMTDHIHVELLSLKGFPKNRILNTLKLIFDYLYTYLSQKYRVQPLLIVFSIFL